MMKSVFISSTSKDLVDYRLVVDRAIRRLELRPINMDDFGSQPGGASGVSAREVSKADIFLGIIARRYGYVPEGLEKSVTEQEYDEAVRLKLPRLMYLLDSAYEWPPERVENDQTAQSRLAVFRARIEKNEVRSLFTTPDSLAAQVTADLTKVLDKQQRQQLITRLMMVLAVVIVVLVVVILGSSETRTAVMVGLGAITRTYTPSPTWTPSNTPTPTNTPTVTPTPLESAKFAEDKVGVVVADFKYIDVNAAKTEPNLEREFTKAGIPYIRVHHELQSREEAQAVSNLYNATIVMWGEVARGGIELYFEVTPRRSKVRYSVDDLHVVITQLTSFEGYIFDGMDSLYLVDYVQGQLGFYEGQYPAAVEALSRAIGGIPAGREKDVKADIAYMLRGAAYYFLDQYQQSVADLSRAIEIDPTNALAYGTRSSSYNAIGDTEAALADVGKAIELQQKTDILYLEYLNRAGFYLLTGQIDFARADYDTAIRLQPDQADAYASRASTLLYLGIYDPKMAIADFDRAIELEPGYADYYLERGKTYQSLGDTEQAQHDFERALQLYDKAVAENPDDAEVYTNRSGVYLAMNDIERALADLNQAVSLQPEFAGNYSKRASVYDQSGDFQHAIDDSSTAIRLSPDSMTLYVSRANIYIHYGDAEKASEDINRVLALSPDFASAHMLLGIVVTQQGKYDEALDAFNRSIELSPGFPVAYTNRGNIFVILENNVSAIADFNRAIELAPNDAAAYALRGVAYQNEKEYEKALSDFSRSLEIAPLNAVVHLQRGLTYFILKDYEQALNDFNHAVELNPTSADYYYWRGYTYYLLGKDNEQVIRDLTQAIKLNPNHPEYYFIRAVAFYRTDEFEKAIQDYDQSLRLDPQNANTYLNRAFAYAQIGKLSGAAADYWQFVGRNQTQRMTLDHFQQGKATVLEMHTGWVYAVPFDGTAGQHITASATSVEKDTVDPVLILLSANSNPVVFNDDISGDNFNSAITNYVLPSDGRYILIVSHAGGGSEGKFEVFLEVQQGVETTPEATVSS